MQVSVKMDNLEVKRHLVAMKGKHKNVMVKSLNRVVVSTKTAASKDIRERVNIKKRDLEKNMSIRKANYRYPRATITTVSKSKGIGLYKFGGRKNSKRKYASFAMTKGKRKYIPHSFVVTMKSGHTGIYLRKGKSKLPVEGKFGPSAAKLMRSKRVAAVVNNTIKLKWKKEYERNLEYQLKK